MQRSNKPIQLTHFFGQTFTVFIIGVGVRVLMINVRFFFLLASSHPHFNPARDSLFPWRSKPSFKSGMASLRFGICPLVKFQKKSVEFF